MNALWLTRICKYRNSAIRVESAAELINQKIERRGVLLKKYRQPVYQIEAERQLATVDQILLHEARAARHFWRFFSQLLPDWGDFLGRKPRAPDMVNQLLDVGYHHLKNKTLKLISKHNLPASVGILHEPRNMDSEPLAYDLMELFRADIVDAEVLRFLRLKKRPFEPLDQHHIGRFLHEVNERLERKYYLQTFRQCHTYHYYMELQLLKFISAVNNHRVFEPVDLPARHDTRCS